MGERTALSIFTWRPFWVGGGWATVQQVRASLLILKSLFSISICKKCLPAWCNSTLDSWVDIYKARPSSSYSCYLKNKKKEKKIHGCLFLNNPTLRRFLPLIHPYNMINIIASKKSVEKSVGSEDKRDDDGIESIFPSVFFSPSSSLLSFTPKHYRAEIKSKRFRQDFLLERLVELVSLNW